MDMFNSYVAVISRGKSKVPLPDLGGVSPQLVKPGFLPWLIHGWFMADDYLLFQAANAVVLVIYRWIIDDFIDERLNLND